MAFVAPPGKAIVGAGQQLTPESPLQHDFDERHEKAATTLPAIVSDTSAVAPNTQVLHDFKQLTLEPHLDYQLFSNQSPDDSQSFYGPLLPSTEEFQPFSVPLTTLRIDSKEDCQRYIQGVQRGNQRDFGNHRQQMIARFRPLPAPSKTAERREPMDVFMLNRFTPNKAAAPRRSRQVDVEQTPCDVVAVSPAPSASPDIRITSSTPSTKGDRAVRTHKRKRSADTDNLEDDKKHKHQRHAPSKTVADGKADEQWREIKDYCEHLPSLGDNRNALKVTWRHTSEETDKTDKEMSAKPDWKELAPAEQKVCNVLRLEPQKYLANKRRIFAAYVKFLKERVPGKDFTRTAAQQACKCDVGKASQLHQAFTEANWFDEQYFQAYL
ncbi:hypothetical protein BAUCODRAFT_33931 [Baudoinia panamericana UAMH 10762]|uniref:SWIRM domain-containing protein n=1 Tax=Baudoinia panamericana (strain UAMH 10762) TaxID=717646 RepID=M2MYC3_BAUPA|nr:uncharacterized protein BAUCODRAFT_33931 [Baudoinia panamericana UAMH 10762]EMC96568.1 hypothetical protein BAUCODRAFT_33931 [Baudoinia panamericana UAMH 10762]